MMDTHARYIKALYEIRVSDLRYIPPCPGVYVLTDCGKFYCGHGGSLAERIPQSIREQGFGDIVYFFPVELLNLPRSISEMQLVKDLEASTISALHTIIYGNGLPLELTNTQYAEWLPRAAWFERPFTVYNIGIEIAQSVLQTIGVPTCMTELPHFDICTTNLPLAMLRENLDRWQSILAVNDAARGLIASPITPLRIMHPA